MKAKHWLTVFLALLIAILFCAAALVVYTDPFLHYHAPNTDRFFYTFDNQRSVNDGIIKQMDYDALITGTSMTVNFRTSELDSLFGTQSIKVPAAGATFYETNNLISTAFEHNSELKYVFRSIDRNLLLYGSGKLRDDLGEYPDYLYDNNIFNDYKYVFNADVLFGRTINMLMQTRQPDFVPGYTSFDDYSNTMEEYEDAFGLASLDSLYYYPLNHAGQPRHLSEEELNVIKENVSRNMVDIAKAHPEASFYYFLPPYSLAFWHNKIYTGDIYAQFEAEQAVIELMLECDNIKLYDFSVRHDIISDVNNYRDLMHYGDWINSFMLKWMQEDQYRLTKDNYKDILAQQFEYYIGFDYSTLLEQPRHNCDYYAAALLNEELTGIAPRCISEEELMSAELRSAALEKDPDSGECILRCEGTLPRDVSQDLADFLYYQDFIGMSLSLTDAADYSYLCFMGRNTGHHGQPTVYAYNEQGECIASVEKNYYDLQGGWQIFALDLRKADGPVQIVFNGGYSDHTGHSASSFEFKDFKLY